MSQENVEIVRAAMDASATALLVAAGDGGQCEGDQAGRAGDPG